MPEETSPSEALYDIVPQPGPSCGIINEALDVIIKTQRKIKGYEKADEDELREMLSDVEYALSELSGYGNSGFLEDIRTRTTEIRTWGQEWKILAKAHVILD